VSRLLAALAAPALAAGCVERYVRIDSDPAGARIAVTGLGRDGRVETTAPAEIPFTYYGTLRVDAWVAGRPGVTQYFELDPPWYQRFPFELFAELLDPFTHVDRHELRVVLAAAPAQEQDAALKRAGELREETR
jgi:hypothetical protein